MKLASIEDVYAHQLSDLRSAEMQLIEALPRLAATASDKKLQQALAQHHELTEAHLERLELVIAASPSPLHGEKCEAMRGLIEEGERVVHAEGPGEVKDVALIAVAQRIEHYEIAAYGTARALADQLDQREAHQLLTETLEEERQVDELLTKLATGGLIVSGINERAHG
jgi:ferritin-like metal-binding protein YciE